MEHNRPGLIYDCACVYVHIYIYIYICACVLHVHHCMYACVHAHLHSHIASMIKTVFAKIRSKCTYVNLHVSLIEQSTRHYIYLSYARCYIWLWWVGNHDYIPLITHLFNWLTYPHVIPKGHGNSKQCHTHMLLLPWKNKLLKLQIWYPSHVTLAEMSLANGILGRREVEFGYN